MYFIKKFIMYFIILKQCIAYFIKETKNTTKLKSKY